MEQRQLRLGDTLDDYCPRERRLTNHAIVAMVGPDVKQTRCTACDTEHEYKHAKVPRQRRKPDSPAALYGQVAAGAPKRVVHDPPEEGESLERPASAAPAPLADVEPPATTVVPEREAPLDADEPSDREPEGDKEEGPVHRPLIRASLPRPEGQPPPARPIPEFTIRQPGGRPGRFRPRQQRGGGAQPFFSNRSNGNVGGGGPQRGGGQRPGGGRPPQGTDPRAGRRHGPGRRRPK